MNIVDRFGTNGLTRMSAFVKDEFFLATALTIALIAIPFAVVDWLPMIDLPHHLSQARLAGNALTGNQPDMVIHWLSPNSLTTWLLTCLSFLPPLIASKAAVFGLMVLSILGIAILAKKTGGSPATIPLSAALLFNQSFYWGFLPFMAGFATFLFLVSAWLSLTRFSWWEHISMALLFLLVYFSHIFWFAVSIIAVVLIAFDSPHRNIKLRTIFIAVLPAVVFAIFWYPSMHDNWMNAGFDMSPKWIYPLGVRLRPDYAAFAISGLISNLNLLLAITIFSFITFGVIKTISGKGRIVSIPLFRLAAILLVIYLSMPDKYSNSILFSIRWLPYVLIFFLLGSFAPVKNTKWRIGILMLCLMVLSGYALLTANTWEKVERQELSGIEKALERLPPGQNVLGLNYILESKLISTENPFVTIVVYAHALKDCEVNFSFAVHASSLITYKQIPISPYKSNLTYYSELVSREDVSYFDYVLVNADNLKHYKVSTFLGITPITHEGRWRLYKVRN